MSPRAIFCEVWRNITSGNTRTVLFGSIFTLVVGVLLLAELFTAHTLSEEAKNYRAAGASVLTLAADAHIDGSACAALGTVSGVHAAGAIRGKDGGLVVAALPSSTVPLWEVTEGFSAILEPGMSAGTGVIISDQLAETLHLDSGESLQTTGNITQIGAVYRYPDDGRRPGYGYAVLSPVPETDPFDECWIEVWPMSVETRSLLYTALIPGQEEDTQIVFSQLNANLGAVFDNSRFVNRITQYAAIAAGIFGAALAYIAVRIRRVEHASALHAGLDKISLTLLATLEMFSWVIAGVIFTISVTAIFSAYSDDPANLFLLAARVIALAALGAGLGTLIGIGLTKENQLFRYVKNHG